MRRRWTRLGFGIAVSLIACAPAIEGGCCRGLFDADSQFGRDLVGAIMIVYGPYVRLILMAPAEYAWIDSHLRSILPPGFRDYEPVRPHGLVIRRTHAPG